MNKISNIQIYFGQLMRREYTLEELEQRLDNPNLDSPEIKQALRTAITAYRRFYKSHNRS